MHGLGTLKYLNSREHQRRCCVCGRKKIDDLNQGDTTRQCAPRSLEIETTVGALYSGRSKETQND